MKHGRLIVFISFGLALLLAVLPLPDWARAFRPQWYTLVLIYWCIALPEHVGVLGGWLLGLLVDVLTGTVLGQHALSLAIIAFIATSLHRRIRVMPRYQQMLTMLSLLAIEKLLSRWIVAITSDHPAPPMYWGGAVVGALLWPWVYIILRDLRRRFRVG